MEQQCLIFGRAVRAFQRGSPGTAMQYRGIHFRAPQELFVVLMGGITRSYSIGRRSRESHPNVGPSQKLDLYMIVERWATQGVKSGLVTPKTR